MVNMPNLDDFHKLLKAHFQIDGKYKVDDKGIVNVQGDVLLTSKLDQIPIPFGEVSGDFICERNLLTTLQNSPRRVLGSFNCEYNQLTSLEGAPQEVGWSFACSYNHLTHLKGAPHSVEFEFSCANNPLVSLEGAPDMVAETFICSYDRHLPVLRLINYSYVDFANYAPPEVTDILKKYSGEGKAGALRAAAELVKSGFKENARW